MGRLLAVKEMAFVNALFGAAKFKEGEAAVLAGYKSPSVAASILLKRPKIQAELARRFTELSLGSHETLYRVSQIARGAMPNFLDNQGNIVLDSEIAQKNYHLLKKVKRTRNIKQSKDGEEFVTETIEIETYDALTALTLLMKYHNLLAQESPPPGSNVTNNTLVLTSPEQIKSAGIDSNLVAQEIDRLRAKWNVLTPRTSEITQVDTHSQDITDVESELTQDDITKDTE